MKKIKTLLQWYFLKRGNEFYATYNQEHAWMQIQRKIWRKQLKRYIYYGAAACGCMWLAISGYLYYQSNRNLQIKTSEILARTPENRAILHLPNGESYALENRPAPLLIDYEGLLQKSKKAATITRQTDTLLAYGMLEVPRGAEYILQLPDSSRIHLNAASKLKYPLILTEKAQKREVFLESGEAYIEVTPDKKKPFVVHTPLTDIEVLGTKFNVALYDTTCTRIALLEGLVKLHGKSFHTHLHPGETAAVYPDSSQITSGTDYSAMLWTKGVYEYYDTELQQITRQLSLWYDVDFKFADPHLATHKFAGVIIKKYPLHEVLHMLEKVSKVKFQINPDYIEITR